MAASYPGSVKTFSTKAPGQAIASSHINELQDEVVAIETELKKTTATTSVNAADSAKLGGVAAASFQQIPTWQSYTPTWTAYTGTPTLGNGTITGRYCKVGKMVIATVSLTFGSTTSVAGTITWYIGLPFQAAGLGHGVWVAYESGVKYYTGVVQVKIGETTIVAFFASDGQGYFSETRPHTWKANDQLTFTAIYQVA